MKLHICIKDTPRKFYVLGSLLLLPVIFSLSVVYRRESCGSLGLNLMMQNQLSTYM